MLVFDADSTGLRSARTILSAAPVWRCHRLPGDREIVDQGRRAGAYQGAPEDGGEIVASLAAARSSAQRDELAEQGQQHAPAAASKASACHPYHRAR